MISCTKCFWLIPGTSQPISTCVNMNNCLCYYHPETDTDIVETVVTTQHCHAAGLALIKSGSYLLATTAWLPNKRPSHCQLHLYSRTFQQPQWNQGSHNHNHPCSMCCPCQSYSPCSMCCPWQSYSPCYMCCPCHSSSHCSLCCPSQTCSRRHYVHSEIADPFSTHTRNNPQVTNVVTNWKQYNVDVPVLLLFLIPNPYREAYSYSTFHLTFIDYID